jgi:hypothetical protein
MSSSVGLDKRVKARESVPARLVRMRALFQLLNLWVDWRTRRDPSHPVELARHLRLLVGLSSTAQAARELRTWLPERSLVFVLNDIASIKRTIVRLKLDDQAGIDQFTAHLDELAWYCQLANLLYRLERQVAPHSQYAGLRHDQITQAVEVVNLDPELQGGYSELFARGVRVVSRAAKLWRKLQRETRSFLSGAEPPASRSGAINQR